MAMVFGSRRGVYIDISKEIKPDEKPLSSVELEHFEMFDLIIVPCVHCFSIMPLHPDIREDRFHQDESFSD